MESWLFDHRDWPKLTAAAREAVPEAARMRRIEAQLEAIDRTYDTPRPQLVRTAATTRAGLLAGWRRCPGSLVRWPARRARW